MEELSCCKMLIVEDGSVNNGEVFVDDSSLLTGDEVYNDDDGHENTNEEGEEQDDSVTEPRVPDASRDISELANCSNTFCKDHAPKKEEDDSARTDENILEDDKKETEEEEDALINERITSVKRDRILEHAKEDARRRQKKKQKKKKVSKNRMRLVGESRPTATRRDQEMKLPHQKKKRRIILSTTMNLMMISPSS